MSLYAPVPEKLEHILGRSAICGLPEEQHLRLAYEGGRYSEIDFVEKLQIAAWRLSDRAPSVAVAHAHPEDVREIALVVYDPVLRGWVIEEIRDEQTALDWLGEVPVTGGTEEQKRRAAGLIMSGGSNTAAMMAFQRAKAMHNDPVEAVLDYARTH